MRICIDSNQFIFGIEGSDSASEELMMLLGQPVRSPLRTDEEQFRKHHGL